LPLSLLALLHPQGNLPLKVNFCLLDASLYVCILLWLLILVTLAHLGILLPGVALPQVCQVHIIRVKPQLLPGHLTGPHRGFPSLTHVRLDDIISVILLL
jgi:hypothetical protein